MSHIHEKIDFTASALIVYKDRVLLRRHQKYNLWLAPGGHIELHEDPITAVLREVAEEVGLTVEIVSRTNAEFTDGTTDLPVPAFMNRHFTTPDHEHIDLLYVARAQSDLVHPQDSPENAGAVLKWFSAAELGDEANEILPRVRYYAQEALQLVAQHT